MYFRQDSESRGEIGSFPHRKSTLVSCIADSLPTDPPRKPITLKTKVKNACPYWMKSKNFFFLGKPSGPIKRSWDSKWHLKVLKKKKKKKIWFLSNYQKKAPFIYTHTHTHISQQPFLYCLILKYGFKTTKNLVNKQCKKKKLNKCIFVNVNVFVYL